MAMDNDDLIHLDNDSLISEWARAEAAIIPLRERMLRAEWLLQRSMEADGATLFPSADGTATLAPSRVTYDGNVLDGLFEIIDPTELASSGAVIPAHEETVERKWNATKVKSFARRSRAARETIESAKMPGTVRLTIRSNNA